MLNIGTIAVSVLFVWVAKAQQAQRPNIMYIMADDQGWNDVDWHDPTLNTPILNQLAHSNNTVQLENAYVNQCCSP
jgi:arylsulfatase A-like enzyme